MATQRIPLVGSLINRANSAAVAKDQQFINCFPQVVKNPISGAGRAYLYKRCGYTSSSPANAIAGSYGKVIWTGKADGTSPALFSYLKSGGTNTMVFNGTTQVGGDIGTTNNCYALTETMVSTTSNLAGIFVDSTTGLFEGWIFPEGGAWAQIANGAFPPNLGTPEPLCIGGGPVAMDGFLFWGTQNGKIWNSDLNSVTAYTANSYITDQSYPDGLVGIARYKNLILAFGKYSLTPYQNTGNAPGSPLTVVANATTRVGALPGNTVTTPFPNMIQSINDNVYWIGMQADTGQPGIFRMNGYAPEKISTPYIDSVLPLGAFIAGGFAMNGLSFVMVGLAQTDSSAYVYCIDTGFWYLWSIGTNSFIFKAICASSANSWKSTSTTEGKLYTSAPSTFTDDGNAFTQTVQTEPIDMGTLKSKTWDRLRIVGDTQASGTLSISWSDDDYANFSTPVTIDLTSWDAMGDGITGLGASRRRIWKITHSANTPNRLTDIELDYTVGPN